jgi:hypothetical protein
VTAERESAGQVNTQAVVVPTERHLAVYQLLRSTSRTDRNGELVSWWPQDKLAAKLGCSVRTLQNVLGDLREPGTDPRHPRRAAGLRLGLVRVVPTTYRDKATGRHRLGGNAYVIVPGQHATLGEPVSAAQVNTQEDDVACLNKKGTSRGGYQGIDEGDCEPAPREPPELPAVLDVGHQRPLQRLDHDPTRAEILDCLEHNLGPVRVIADWPNDQLPPRSVRRWRTREEVAAARKARQARKRRVKGKR